MQLLTYPGHFDEPSNSPFCVKAMCLLEMSGLKWEAVFTSDPRRAPFSKLPVLLTDNDTIADSSVIAGYLQTRADIDFDAVLDTTAKAHSHALIRMCEEHLYFALVHERWANDDNWAIIREAYFEDIPKLIRKFAAKSIRKSAVASLEGQGLGRLPYSMLLERVTADLAAIENSLEDKPFLFGAQPTAADASVAPFLAAIAVTPKSTAITRLVQENSVLMEYINRARCNIYPKR